MNFFSIESYLYSQLRKQKKESENSDPFFLMLKRLLYLAAAASLAAFLAMLRRWIS